MPEFVTKIIQIFDCKVARHGNMIVGKTGAGKSVAWQTLQRAMGRLRKDGHESEQFQKVSCQYFQAFAMCFGKISGIPCITLGCRLQATHGSTQLLHAFLLLMTAHFTHCAG